jgi:hypothetical protein
MLNYEIRWKNFRCFKDTGWLEIPPITVLLGANNSGKSSLINPLLLLKQTWQSYDPETSLVTRGEIVDLGTFRELIHSHDLTLDLFFGLRFHTHDLDDELQPLGDYPPGALELSFSSSESPFGCSLKRYKVLDIFKRTYLTRSLLKSGHYSLRGGVFGSMPSSERRALTKTSPVNFLFSATEALDAVRESGGKDAGPAAQFSKELTMYLSVVNNTYRNVTSFLRNLSYIGPLRDRPKRYYERGGEIYRSVGMMGQHAADLLYYRYDEISERLNHWIKLFGLGKKLKYRDLSSKSNLFEILLESERTRFTTNFADAGFGASQLLPLIVQALVAEEETLTIAEQPEIHLNPKLQTLLADLFVEMATTAHRVIIETHSEHLLLRLRVLVAEGKIPADDVAVYFISKTDGESTIRRVSVEADGHIDPQEWPPGFFGETLRESLALANAQALRPK